METVRDSALPVDLWLLLEHRQLPNCQVHFCLHKYALFQAPSPTNASLPIQCHRGVAAVPRGWLLLLLLPGAEPTHPAQQRCSAESTGSQHLLFSADSQSHPPRALTVMQREENMFDPTQGHPPAQLALEGPSTAYLGMNNGVCIVQPDVVIDEDVVNAGIMGVDPQGLPTSGRELISGPPETASVKRNCQGRRGRQLSVTAGQAALRAQGNLRAREAGWRLSCPSAHCCLLGKRSILQHGEKSEGLGRKPGGIPEDEDLRKDARASSGFP